MRNVVAAVALAVLLAGCSSGTQSGAPGSTGGASVTSTPGSGTPGSSSGTNPTAAPPVQPPVSISEEKPVVPAGVTPLPKEKVDTTSLSETYRTEAYVFGDGRDVEVFGVGGGCKEARAEVTAQSAEVVQITLVTITKQPPGQMCTQEIRQVPLTVRLDAPLGDRRLVLESREETG